MIKLAANLTMLFNEHPFMDRFEQAAQSGFRGVEFLFPYAFDVGQIAEKLAAHKLELVLHNLPAGDWEAGERGIACHPDRVNEFQDGVGKAVAFAKALGVKQLNCLLGKVPAGVTIESAMQCAVTNLRYAADMLQEHKIRMLIEPVNSFDIPGFSLTHTQQAIDLIKETGSANIYLQYDIYHMQRMEGELASTIRANRDIIRHIQVADNPGRFEPGTGEINYRFLFKLLEDIGYDGWIGCEYKPRAGTVDGLGWRSAHGV